MTVKKRTTKRDKKESQCKRWWTISGDKEKWRISIKEEKKREETSSHEGSSRFNGLLVLIPQELLLLRL